MSVSVKLQASERNTAWGRNGFYRLAQVEGLPYLALKDAFVWLHGTRSSTSKKKAGVNLRLDLEGLQALKQVVDSLLAELQFPVGTRVELQDPPDDDQGLVLQIAGNGSTRVLVSWNASGERTWYDAKYLVAL
jgi:hypothetical protein